MKRRMVVVGVVTAVIVLAVCVWTSISNPTGGKERDASDAASFEDVADKENVVDWLGWLTDEQLAELDIAYEADANAGYAGSREDWLVSEVRTHLDSRSDVVIRLPDGGEFTVVPQVKSDVSSGDSSEDDQNDSDESKGESGGGSGASDAGQSSEVSETEAPSLDKSSVDDSHESNASENTSAQNTNSVLDVMPEVKVGTVETRQGQTRVAVPITIKDNPGILGMTLSISYDESALTLTDAENGEAFRGILTMTHSRDYGSGCQFAWDGLELAKQDVHDGVILTLYFDVADGTSGSYAVVAHASNAAFDANLDEITLVLENGSVVVR